MKKNQLVFIIILTIFCIFFSQKGFSQTQILKWQDGKEGCATLTYDDGSLNQFRIALPLMNERGFLATFFINTGSLEGSEYKPTFVGRPIQEIIDESAHITTNKNNLYERCSALRYLGPIRKIDAVKDFDEMNVGEIFEEGKHQEAYVIVDNALSVLRKSEQTYHVDKAFSYSAGGINKITWDDLQNVAEQGHEIGNHTITHPYLPIMDKANILYEVEKCKEDILNNLGFKHSLSIECPYGIEDERVMEYVKPIYPFLRNRITEPYIKEILRGDPEEPVSAGKEYVQWQRGPLSKTPMDEMKKWIDITMDKNVWLVLVFHGVEGIGWEALPKEKFVEYFDYIKVNEHQLWIATFQDAFKYIRERMHSKIDLKMTQDIITISLSNNLDSQIYNLALYKKKKTWPMCNTRLCQMLGK